MIKKTSQTEPKTVLDFLDNSQIELCSFKESFDILSEYMTEVKNNFIVIVNRFSAEALVQHEEAKTLEDSAAVKLLDTILDGRMVVFNERIGAAIANVTELNDSLAKFAKLITGEEAFLLLRRGVDFENYKYPFVED